ncbi:iron-containing alcohol dehydrogenase [Clostridium tyrobutyricum]|uniref:iron-containing alcohol dehydrogenase n=1 Tax=Clostridium tyrobutyricum TaxID=1519 RepID=UPI001C38B813|nr:iron-containing alcohol dehydrogenase [Clostridium tyrobutyricum]MBV4418863.1 iron-containing alcohol dehydrogenase [Clostridium tyrobutyricum]
MKSFEFSNKTSIIFGKEVESTVGKRINDISKNKKVILIHYGDGLIEKIGLYDRVIKSLTEANLKIIELKGIKPNPDLSKIHEGIEICKKNNVDFILAIGGGSIIDTAKSIAAGVPYDGDVWDYFTGKAGTVEEALPIGVITTMPASGSETSTGAVISKSDTKQKLSIDSLKLRPSFAMLNPELTIGIPPFLTACGVVDIMSHTMEKYFSPGWKNDFTDRLCEALLKSMIYNGRIVMENPKDIDARSEIMLAASFSHNGYTDSGRTSDWASHFIEHEVSAIYDVTHAAGLTAIIPAWMKYVYKEDVNRFVQYAVRVWGVDLEYGSLEKIALEGINRNKNFYKELHLPTSLTELNINDKYFEEMASKATINGPLGSFKKLYKEDIVEILKLAL